MFIALTNTELVHRNLTIINRVFSLHIKVDVKVSRLSQWKGVVKTVWKNVLILNYRVIQDFFSWEDHSVLFILMGHLLIIHEICQNKLIEVQLVVSSFENH